MTDTVTLVKELVSLIKDRELEQAALKAKTAFERMYQESFRCRVGAIEAANLELQRHIKQREKLKAAVLELPEEERIFVEVQVEAVIDKVYEPVITALKAKKRALARPA